MAGEIGHCVEVHGHQTGFGMSEIYLPGLHTAGDPPQAPLDKQERLEKPLSV